MLEDRSAYFERIGSTRRFILSILLGIIGASLFSISLTEILKIHLPDLHWAIPLTSFLSLIWLAYHLSCKSETIVSSVSAKVDPESFESLFNTFSKQIYELDGDLKDSLVSMRSVLTKALNLDSSNITILQTYGSELRSAMKKRGGSISAFLAQLNTMIMNIQNIESIVIDSAKGKTSFYKELGYQLGKEEDGIKIKKKKWPHSVLISYRFESNLGFSILNPLICRIELNPFISFKEYANLRASVPKFLNHISSDKRLLIIGLAFDESTLSEYLGSQFKELAAQVSQAIDDSITEQSKRFERAFLIKEKESSEGNT